MVEGFGGLLLGLFLGLFLGVALSADLRTERLESCLKLNMTLVDCMTVNGWGK